MYPSLEKGVVDGAAGTWLHMFTQKFDEVCDYYLDYTFGSNQQMLLMSLNTWNSFPPDVQKIITEILPEAYKKSQSGYADIMEKGKTKVQSNPKKTITTLTQEQRKLWDNLVQPLEQTWVNNMKSKGITDAEAILTFMKQKAASAQ